MSMASHEGGVVRAGVFRLEPRHVLWAGGVLYFLGIQVAFLMPSHSGILALAWPPGGVGLAALVLMSRRRWPAMVGVLLGVGVASNLWSGRPWAASVGFMVVNVAESVVGALILGRWSPEGITFGRVRDVAGLVTVATVGNAVTATAGAGLAWGLTGVGFWTAWMGWWVADGLGIMLVTPLLVTWATRSPRPEVHGGLRWQESVLLGGLTVGLAWLAFGPDFPFLRPYMLFALLAWGAIRLGPRGVSVQLALLATAVLVWALIGQGSRVAWGESVPERLQAIQSFLAVASGTGLVLAASVAEREAAQHELWLRSLALDQTPDLVGITDLDGRLLYVNEAACVAVGRARGAMVGRHVEGLNTDPGWAAKHGEVLCRTAADGRWRGETVVGRDGGPGLILDLRTKLIRDPVGKPMAMIGIATDITGRKRAEDAWREGEDRYRLLSERYRTLAARVQAAREEERIRIAREIHDVLAQELTRLKLDLAWIQRRMNRLAGHPEAVRTVTHVTGMMEAVDTAIRSVQHIATDLRPVVLDTLGLGAAVEWLVRDFQERTGIRCSARVMEAGSTPPRQVATALYRILQESLTNVARHAHATEVEVVFETGPDGIRLSIRDNGCGILPEVTDRPSSIGLTGMRERVLLLGGEFGITSSPGSGTRIEVRLGAGTEVPANDPQPSAVT